MSANDGQDAARLLPAPDRNENAEKVEVNSDKALKFDTLGPMVVNSDGTLSRIANWRNMTELERERTIRVLSARNQIRIANQENKQAKPGVEPTPSNEDK